MRAQLTTSALAVGQSNGKKILAYSTIANLGLIIACAGVNTPASIAAAVMLIIFHAVAKSSLFLCVGSVEHIIDSRDIEAMDSLVSRVPAIAYAMIVGIGGMFLPPLGMLVKPLRSTRPPLTALTTRLCGAPLLLPVLPVSCSRFGIARTLPAPCA